MKNIEKMTLAKPSASVTRFSMLLWGPVGSGKTVLASTAPGTKLWLLFDPNGADSLTFRDDIIVLDLSGEPDAIVREFSEDDPLRLSKYLQNNPEIKTVVFDSFTSFGDRALIAGVDEAKKTPKGRDSTIENPGYSGYGNKSAWTRTATLNLLRITAQQNCNMIFTAHEDKAERDKAGLPIHISIMLGSSLVQQVPLNIGEVWRVFDDGKKRVIQTRSRGLYRPMRSRMFQQSPSQFVWDFNAETNEGGTISDWWEQWRSNQFRKIPVPTGSKA